MDFSSTLSTKSAIKEIIITEINSIIKKQNEFLKVKENAFIKECSNIFDINKDAKHLIVLGIGGSALGTKSVLQALNIEKVTVIDHIDPIEIKKILKNIDFDKTIINVISKSGKTLETMLQLGIIEKILNNKYSGNFSKKIIVTTSKNSNFEKYAKENKYSILNIKEEIGGRFSIFTPVGVFPLMFAGLDIKKFLNGAISVIKNPEIIIDFINAQFLSYKNNKRSITVLMSYQKRLMGLLDWYRQLLAESLGKNENTGITPVLAYGSTDQHSQIQLYCEGPQDKLILFLTAPFETDYEKYKIFGIEKELGISETQKALFEGTKKGLKKCKRPFIEIGLYKVSEEEIGKFFMTCMLQITVLATLLNVNPFNQPGVEEGKKQTLNILN